MKTNIDVEDMKGCAITEHKGNLLKNNVLDIVTMQGHFNMKTEFPATLVNCNNSRNVGVGTQVDSQMKEINIKKELSRDLYTENGSNTDNSLSNHEKVFVKQEIPEVIPIVATQKDFPHCTAQSYQKMLKNSVPVQPMEQETETFIPYCDLHIKREVNDINPEDLTIKNESVDLDDTVDMIQMENGCTNSGCNSQKRCLHTYKCSKCSLIFTEKDVFAAHFKKCRLNKNSSVGQAANTTSPTAHKTHEYDYSSQNLKKLIENVKTNPCLYNMDNEDYNDTQLKEVIWANIACDCSFPTGSFAKAAWKKLKDSFRDALTQQNNSHIHQTKTHTRHFKYQKQMEFLKPFLSYNLQDNGTNSDHAIPDVDFVGENTEMDVSIMQQLGTPAKKQKIMPSANETSSVINTNKRNREGRTKVGNHSREAKVRSSSSTHPLHMFFLSMCETTKNLPPHLQLRVKRRVFQAVIEAEEETNNNLPRASTSSQGDPFMNTVASFSLDSLTTVVDNSSSSSQED